MAKGQTNVIFKRDTSLPSPSPCTNIVATGKNGKITLTWTDPPEREVISDVDVIWASTTVRYKEGSAPTSAKDGTLAAIETTRNQYSETRLTITGLKNDTTYYVSVLPKSKAGIVNAEGSQVVEVTVVETIVYTVKIDQSNSNPLSCCTYADDAIEMAKGSSDWDDIFGYKPCIMEDGVVQGYLNPNDFTKYEDGTDAPITDTTYDVMIEFPRRGLNISTEGDVITVSLTMEQNDSDFQYNAFRRGSTQKDYFYLGAYDATDSSNNKLGSNSDQSPLKGITLTDFITYAHNRSTGYEIMGFYQWTYIQALYVLKYGNLNSQVALGMGNVGGSQNQMTGVTNTKGMCYGDPSDPTLSIKLFGLEDAWGHVYQCLSGVYSDSNYNILTTTDNFGVSTTASDWEYIVSSGLSKYTYGYMTKAQGTNIGGFLLKASDGSSSTYFSDYGSFDSGFFKVKGNWEDGDNAGMFNVTSTSLTTTYAVGSRLMFL